MAGGRQQCVSAMLAWSTGARSDRGDRGAYQMVERDRVDDAKLGEIVAVRRIVAVPRDDIEWRVILMDA